MKKLLLIAAVASMATPAFASKARLNSLGNAEHLIDTQTVFNNPSHAVWMADYATFEMGQTNRTYNLIAAPGPTSLPSNTANAEGGFTRSSGDAKYMFYLGRKSDFTSLARPTVGFLGQENPIEVQYAMKGAVNWGVGFNYSSSDKKSTTPTQKQSAMGIRLGASTDTWEGYGIIGLGSEATGNTAVTGLLAADADSKYKGTAGFKFGGAYKMENIYLFAKYTQDGFKYESSAAANAALNGAEITTNVIEVGVVDHNKIEGGQWFYGVSYSMDTDETKGASGAAAGLNTKTETNTLPFLLGMEYDMTSWATLRASVKQSVLVGSVKSTPGSTDTVANNTTVGVGAGFRLNKFVLDAAMEASKNGDLSLGNGTTKFLTNASLTYNF